MPTNEKKRKVLADTSFLITLFDDTRKNHSVAKSYYKYFIANGIDLYLSVIVISEYTQKASILPIIKTGNFIELPFNVSDGICAGDFARILRGETREEADSRDAVKDDVKLLAQCANSEFDFIITDDRSTLARYADRLCKEGLLVTQPITLNEFDDSIFNNGQASLFAGESVE